MSNLVVQILCPNYEDYEPYIEQGRYLKNWPDMWPEEKHAECALWLEHKKMSANRASWMKDNLHWCRLHTPDKRDKEARAKHSERIKRVLAMLAMKQGWKVNHITMDGRVIYKTN